MDRNPPQPAASKVSVARTRGWQARGLSLVLGACICLASACSVKKFAVRQVGDALSSGPSTFETDPDVDLVGDALPFSLKFVESLLEITPRHRGLLVTAAKGFALYALAYVDTPGEMLADQDYQEGKRLRQRAKRLYLRSLAFSMRALEAAYPGISEDFRNSPGSAASRVSKKHIDLLYWAGAALGLSVSADPTDASMVVRLREVEAMLDRALELDETWDRGAFHEFRLSLESAKPGGGAESVMEASYLRALQLSAGQRAGLFVAYAEVRAIPNQDRELFEELLNKALAVDPDAHEQYRLLNHLAHRRALWLRAKIDDLFL